MPTFDNQSEYNKHQSDCEGKDCGFSTGNGDCGCCPPGLISVTDDCGKNIGCLTPNDAACYEITKHIPPTGYIKAFDPNTGTYLGDLTTQEYLEYLGALDPDVVVPNPEGLFNPTTVDSVNIALAGQGGTSTVNFDYSVDRFNCAEAVLVSLVAPPAGVTFLSGGLSFVMGAEQSSVLEGIQITDAVLAGTYELNVVYSACASNITKTLTIIVS